MVSSTEMPSSISDTGHQHHRDGTEDPTAAHRTSGAGQSHQVLRSQEPGEHYRSDTLENPIGHAERSADVRDEVPRRLSNMDAGGRSTESTLPAEIKSSAGDPGHCLSPPAREPPPLRDLLRGALLGAQLTNDSCWCWANAGLLCTLWALLCRQTFSLEDFGMQIRPVRAFLHRLQAMPGTSVALAFPDLLRSAASKCMPRDVGEFVSELLTWLESEAVSMSWERRFLAGSKLSALKLALGSTLFHWTVCMNWIFLLPH